MFRIRDVYPGSEFLHPGSRICIKEFKPFVVPGCTSRIRIPDPDNDFYPSRTRDPGFKKAPDSQWHAYFAYDWLQPRWYYLLGTGGPPGTNFESGGGQYTAKPPKFYKHGAITNTGKQNEEPSENLNSTQRIFLPGPLRPFMVPKQHNEQNKWKIHSSTVTVPESQAWKT